MQQQGQGHTAQTCPDAHQHGDGKHFRGRTTGRRDGRGAGKIGGWHGSIRAWVQAATAKLPMLGNALVGAKCRDGDLIRQIHLFYELMI
jgi:hypothetical protein